MKKYIKKQTVKAEQFDGSHEMINKYHMKKYGDDSYFFESFFKGSPWLFDIDVHDWIILYDNYDIDVVMNDDFKEQYSPAEFYERGRVE